MQARMRRGDAAPRRREHRLLSRDIGPFRIDCRRGSRAVTNSSSLTEGSARAYLRPCKDHGNGFSPPISCASPDHGPSISERFPVSAQGAAPCRQNRDRRRPSTSRSPSHPDAIRRPEALRPDQLAGCPGSAHSGRRQTHPDLICEAPHERTATRAVRESARSTEMVIEHFWTSRRLLTPT